MVVRFVMGSYGEVDGKECVCLAGALCWYALKVDEVLRAGGEAYNGFIRWDCW